MRVEAEADRERALRVEVDEQDLAAVLRQRGAQVDGRRGLADAALLVAHRDHPGVAVGGQRARLGDEGHRPAGRAERLLGAAPARRRLEPPARRARRGGRAPRPAWATGRPVVMRRWKGRCTASPWVVDWPGPAGGPAVASPGHSNPVSWKRSVIRCSSPCRSRQNRSVARTVICRHGDMWPTRGRTVGPSSGAPHKTTAGHPQARGLDLCRPCALAPRALHRKPGPVQQSVDSDHGSHRRTADPSERRSRRGPGSPGASRSRPG